MAAGASVTISFTAQVAYPNAASVPTGSTALNNSVYASSTDTDLSPNPGYTFPGTPSAPVPPPFLLAADTSTNSGTAPTTPNGDTPSATVAYIPAPILTLTKTIAAPGRNAAADQFTVEIKNGANVTASATTTNTNLTASTAATSLVAGTTYTLTEVMAAGSTSTLANYTSTVACTNTTAGSSTVLPSGAGQSFSITPALGDVITCNLTNTDIISSPTIAKAFSPSPVALNGVSTITFTLTNPNSNTALSNLNFTDTLSGMSVSSTVIGGTCSSVTNSPALAVNATALNLTIPALAASASCTVTVQVKGTSVGTNPNTTSGVTSTQTPVAGAASNTANLIVTPLAPGVSKAFSPTSVVAGATTTLTITVTNPNGVAVTAFALKDDVRTTTTITGLTITSVTTDTCKGAATPTTTNGSYVLSGGTLPAGGCSVVMTVQVPTSAVTAATTNTIKGSDVSGTVGTQSTPNPADATASLSVTALPTLTIIKISSGGVGTFNFLGDNGFGSDSITTTTAGVGGTGATKTLTAINTATTVTETVVASYTTTVNCIDSNSGSTGNTLPVTSSTNVITIPAANIKAGAVYTCTYTNTKLTAVVAPAVTLTKLGRNVTNSVSFVSSNVTVKPKDIVEYCIAYENTGGVAANFVLKDYVPVGMVIVPDAYGTGTGIRWSSTVKAAAGDTAPPAGSNLTNITDSPIPDQGTLDSTPVTNPADPVGSPQHPGLMTLNLGATGLITNGRGTVCFQAKVP